MSKYICEICELSYKHRQSLWNHNKKKHLNDTSNHLNETSNSLNLTDNKLTKSGDNDDILANQCEFCKKNYSRKDNLKVHQRKCSAKTSKLKILTDEIKRLKDELENIKNERNRNNGIVNNGTVNIVNNNINNNINIEKINIISHGNEDTSNDVLSKEEFKKILKKPGAKLLKIIKHTHFNDKYKQYRNIVITNLTNNIGYAYNSDENSFVPIDANQLTNTVMNDRKGEFEVFLETYEDEIDKQILSESKRFLKKFKNKKFRDEKHKEIKYNIYHHSNKLIQENKDKIKQLKQN